MSFPEPEKSHLLKLLAKGITELKLDISISTQQRLIHYLALLTKWNNAYNLTAIRNPQDMIIRHLLDSLAITPYANGKRIIDVGTGAGLPGIPLACVLPDQQFVLLDSNGKKVRFLIQAKAELGLTNIEPVQARVESYQPAACFDTVIARAFTSINDMIKQSGHLCCPNGKILMMKGAYPTAEAELVGIQKTIDIYPLTVPGLNEQRHLVCITELTRG